MVRTIRESNRFMDGTNRLFHKYLYNERMYIIEAFGGDLKCKECRLEGHYSSCRSRY